ncbi:hypothetical protein [Kitasatospora sp. DSM 101779]|uniref:hypothetical protein n=1 Tax=Kitasatospora sp. DSM 101779 TaxID=2853165 RepID=UPI0021DAF1FA|nr:hypothetical protein [Kitasatospora sp. DSM 101779]MCU7820138.1 hypothetical protein [Kitasatospora sp. DSM 101779]
MSVLTGRINSDRSLTAIPLRSTTALEVGDLAPALSAPATLVGSQVCVTVTMGYTLGQTVGTKLPQ